MAKVRNFLCPGDSGVNLRVIRTFNNVITFPFTAISFWAQFELPLFSKLWTANSHHAKADESSLEPAWQGILRASFQYTRFAYPAPKLFCLHGCAKASWQVLLKYIQITAFQEQKNKLITVSEQGSEHGDWEKCHSGTQIKQDVYFLNSKWQHDFLNKIFMISWNYS